MPCLASTGFPLHRELSAWLGGGLALSRNLDLGAAIALLYLQQEKQTWGDRTQRLGLRLKIAPNLELGIWHHSSGALSPPGSICGCSSSQTPRTSCTHTCAIIPQSLCAST